MSATQWLVWTGRNVGGVFPSAGAAMIHCKTLANDHRRKVDILTISPECLRYVGPRGKRHGTSRLVAFVVTPRAAEEIGLNLRALMGPAAECLS